MGGHHPLKPNDLTEHHVVPRSRRGADDETNIIFKPVFVHQAWHQMVVNATVEEIIFLFEGFDCIEKGRGNKFALTCSSAYHLIFRNMTLEKALELIQNRWKKLGGPWEIVFGDVNVSYREAIEIIQREWVMPLRIG